MGEKTLCHIQTSAKRKKENSERSVIFFATASCLIFSLESGNVEKLDFTMEAIIQSKREERCR